MAASIVSKLNLVGGAQMEVYEVQLSSLTSGLLENIATPIAAPRSVLASVVDCVITTSATSGDPISWEWIRANDSTTNNTVAVKFKVPVGGDITGAKAAVFIYFFNRATAGLNPP